LWLHSCRTLQQGGLPRCCSTAFDLVLTPPLSHTQILASQVTDIYKKEDAKYARFTLMTMLLHGYQGRAAILTAGNYGAPQVC
jgi:hypothetical protein